VQHHQKNDGTGGDHPSQSDHFLFDAGGVDSIRILRLFYRYHIRSPSLQCEHVSLELLLRDGWTRIETGFAQTRCAASASDNPFWQVGYAGDSYAWVSARQSG
jgi:hypothetical protein